MFKQVEGLLNSHPLAHIRLIWSWWPGSIHTIDFLTGEPQPTFRTSSRKSFPREINGKYCHCLSLGGCDSTSQTSSSAVNYFKLNKIFASVTWSSSSRPVHRPVSAGSGHPTVTMLYVVFFKTTCSITLQSFSRLPFQINPVSMFFFKTSPLYCFFYFFVHFVLLNCFKFFQQRPFFTFFTHF